MIKETIITRRLNGNRGKVLLKVHYDLVKDFILSELKESKMTLTALISRANEKLGNSVGADLNWCLLQVKMDLQVRRLIKVTLEPGYVQVIEKRLAKQRSK